MLCPLCGSQSQDAFKTQHTQVKKCSNPSCGHLFSENHLSQTGEMDYSETVDFSKFRERNFKMIDYLFQQGYLSQGDKVLDLGSGSGHIARTFVERGIDVVCVEASHSGRKILDSLGLVNYASINDIPIDQTFNLILMIEVIEHLSFPIQALTHIRTRLTDNGVIFITTPCGQSLKPIFNLEKLKTSPAYIEKTHLHFFSKHSLESCFHSAGLSHYQREYLSWMVPDKSSLRDFIDRVKCYLDWDAHLTYFVFNS